MKKDIAVILSSGKFHRELSSPASCIYPASCNQNLQSADFKA